MLQAAVLLRAKKLRISNALLLNKPSGLGGETRMLTNIMLCVDKIMRQIKVKILPGMGSVDGKWEIVNFDDFLVHYSPRLAMSVSFIKQFPPLHILNEELLSGGTDQGMSGGCYWKPFELTEQEYEDIREEMLTSPSHDLKYDLGLEDRKTINKWCGAVLSRHNPRNRSAT